MEDQILQKYSKYQKVSYCSEIAYKSMHLWKETQVSEPPTKLNYRIFMQNMGFCLKW